MKINSMEDLIKYVHLLPFEVLKDIDKRIGDWLASGGNIEDGYIKQQFRYAEKFLREAKESERSAMSIFSIQD